MSHTFESSNNNTTTGITCQRDGCANICSKKSNVNFYRGSSKITRQYLGKSLCDTCINLCCYSDINGNLCTKSTNKPGLCLNHKMLLSQLADYKLWKAAVDFHKSNVYIGSHWEKADDDGPIDIYHYLSRDRYNKIMKSNPNFNFDNFWDYDDEIWISDDLWSYCGPFAESKLNEKCYPKNFAEQIEAKLLVSIV